MRRAATTIVLSAMFLSLVSACASEPEARPDYIEWCQDEESWNRVPDEECENGGSGGSIPGRKRRWVYSLNNDRVPAVGKTASATATRPTTGTIGRAPSSGGFGTFGGGTAGG
jgi:hypothetical protein